MKKCLVLLLVGSVAHAVGGGNHGTNTRKREVDNSWKQNPLNYCARGISEFEEDFRIRQNNQLTRAESGFVRTVDKKEVQEAEIATHLLSPVGTRTESSGRGGTRTINEQGQISKVSMNELLEKILRCRLNNSEESKLEKEAKQSLYSWESGYRFEKRWLAGADYIWAQRIVLDRIGNIATDKKIANALLDQMKLHRQAMQDGKTEAISEDLKALVLELRAKFEKSERFTVPEQKFVEYLTQSKLGKPNEIQTLIGAKALYFSYLFTNGEQKGGEKIDAKVDLPFNALTQQPEFQKINEKAKQLLEGEKVPLASPTVSRAFEEELSHATPEHRALIAQGWLEEQGDGLAKALQATPTSDHDRITRILAAQQLLQKTRALTEHIQVRRAAELGYRGIQQEGLKDWMDAVPPNIGAALSNERNSMMNLSPRQIHDADSLIERATARLGTDLPAEIRQSIREMTPMRQEILSRYLDQMNFKSIEMNLAAAKDKEEREAIEAKLPKNAQELEASRLLLRQAMFGGGASGDFVILARKNGKFADLLTSEVHDSVKTAVSSGGLDGTLSKRLSPKLVRALVDRNVGELDKLITSEEIGEVRDQAAAEVLRLSQIAYSSVLSSEDAARNLKAREGLTHLMTLLDDHGQTEAVSSRAHASLRTFQLEDGTLHQLPFYEDRFDVDYQDKAIRAEHDAKASFEAAKAAGHASDWSINKARHPYVDKNGKEADIGLSSISRAKLYSAMQSPIHRMMLESVIRTLHARGWDDAIAALLADATEEKIEAASKKWDESANSYIVRFFQKDASEDTVVANLRDGWIPASGDPALHRLAILEDRKAKGLPVDHYLTDSEVERLFSEKSEELSLKSEAIKKRLVLDTAQRMLAEGNREQAMSFVKEFNDGVVPPEAILAGLQKQNVAARILTRAFMELEPKIGPIPFVDYEETKLAERGESARNQIKYQQDVAEHSLQSNALQAQDWLREKSFALEVAMQELQATKKEKQGYAPADYAKRVKAAETNVANAKQGEENSKTKHTEALVALAEGMAGVQVDFPSRFAKLDQQQKEERIKFNADQAAKLRDYATKLVSSPETGLLSPGATEQEKEALIASTIEMLERFGGGLKRTKYSAKALARSGTVDGFDAQIMDQIKDRMTGAGPGIRLSPDVYFALLARESAKGHKEVVGLDADVESKLKLLAKAGIQVKEGMLSYQNLEVGSDGTPRVVTAKLDERSLESVFGEGKYGEFSRTLAALERAGVSPDARYSNPSAALRSEVLKRHLENGGLDLFEFDEENAVKIRFEKNPDGSVANFKPSFRALAPLREAANQSAENLDAAQKRIGPAAMARGSFSNAFGHMVVDSANSIGNTYGLPTYVYNPRTGEGHFNWAPRPEYRSEEDRRVVAAEKNYHQRLGILSGYSGITIDGVPAHNLAQQSKYTMTPSVRDALNRGEELFKENLAASQEIAISVLASGATFGLGSVVSGGGALLAGGARLAGMGRFAPTILRGTGVASKFVDAKAVAATKNFWKWAGLTGGLQTAPYGFHAAAAGVDSLWSEPGKRRISDPTAPQVSDIWMNARNSGIFGIVAPPITGGLSKLGVNPIVAQMSGAAGSEAVTNSLDVAKGKKDWNKAATDIGKNVVWSLPSYLWLNWGGKKIHAAGFVPKKAPGPTSALSPSVISKNAGALELVGGKPQLWRNAANMVGTAAVGTATGVVRGLYDDPDNFSWQQQGQGALTQLGFAYFMNKSSRLGAIADYLKKNEMTPSQAAATFGPDGTTAYMGMLKLKDLKTGLTVEVDARDRSPETDLIVAPKGGKPVSASKGVSVSMPEGKKDMMSKIGEEMGFSHGQDLAVAVELYRNPEMFTGGKPGSGFNRIVSAVVRPIVAGNETLGEALPKIRRNYVETVRSNFLSNSPKLPESSIAPAFIGTRVEVAGGFELGQLNFNNEAHRTMVQQFATTARPGRGPEFAKYFAATAEHLQIEGGSKAAKLNLAKALIDFDSLWVKGVRIPVSPDIAKRYAQPSATDSSAAGQ